MKLLFYICDHWSPTPPPPCAPCRCPPRCATDRSLGAKAMWSPQRTQAHWETPAAGLGQQPILPKATVRCTCAAVIDAGEETGTAGMVLLPRPTVLGRPWLVVLFSQLPRTPLHPQEQDTDTQCPSPVRLRAVGSSQSCSVLPTAQHLASCHPSEGTANTMRRSAHRSGTSSLLGLPPADNPQSCPESHPILSWMSALAWVCVHE